MTRLPILYLHSGDALLVAERRERGVMHGDAGVVGVMLSFAPIDPYSVKLQQVNHCPTCRHSDGLGTIAPTCEVDPGHSVVIPPNGSGFCWRHETR